MSFSYIKSINFTYVKDLNGDLNLNDLINNDSSLNQDNLYKIDIIKNKKLKNEIEEYSISLNSSDKEKNIKLTSGNYKLLYKNGSNILNTSKGRIENFNEKNQFSFKISKKEVFSIWLDENQKSNFITFNMIKLLNSKINDAKFNNIMLSFLFNLNNENYNLSSSFLNLEEKFDYIIEIYQLDNIELTKPVEKYPEGTYKIVLNSKICSSSNDNYLISFSKKDQQKFNILNNKIINLNNIIIPDNINPINYYNMIGKIEYLVYLDFINDSYYFQLYSPAECFMSLYLPDSKYEIIEEADSYITFKVTTYKFIFKSYKNINKIHENMSNWLNIEKNKINIDQYKLFHWAFLENNNLKFFYNDFETNYFDIEKKYFVYIKFSITANIYDNVSLPTNNELTIINDDFDINQKGICIKFTECNYELVELNNYINSIEWNEHIQWSNYCNITNILCSSTNGIGIYKISKQRFKNITNINIEENNQGSIDLDKILKFGFNLPEIEPYNRFQFWLRSMKF